MHDKYLKLVESMKFFIESMLIKSKSMIDSIPISFGEHTQITVPVLASISGSSHITDKADIVIAYGKKNFKKKKDEEVDGENAETEEGFDNSDTLRELSVLKNRLTGKLTPYNKPIQLTYDLNSRRVADDTKSLFKIKFDWNTGLQNVDDLEIPF